MAENILNLFWASLPDLSDRYDVLLQLLPPEEQRRAGRFRIDTARYRFVIARTLLRHRLAKLVRARPSDLGFHPGARGKPHLAVPQIESPPHFNLSHSGDLVALVVAGVDVGVDVESLRPVPNAVKLARRFFSPAERHSISSRDGEERDRAFLRIWTQKEAYLKATGIGVGIKLSTVETEPEPLAQPGLIAIAGDLQEAARWKLHDVELPNAVCTVAAPPILHPPEVRRFTFADLELD